MPKRFHFEPGECIYPCDAMLVGRLDSLRLLDLFRADALA
jgi:hypothetical protein